MAAFFASPSVLVSLRAESRFVLKALFPQTAKGNKDAGTC
jgi:hypothetical protein